MFSIRNKCMNTTIQFAVSCISSQSRSYGQTTDTCVCELNNTTVCVDSHHICGVPLLVCCGDAGNAFGKLARVLNSPALSGVGEDKRREGVDRGVLTRGSDVADEEEKTDAESVD
jgi:hypothetical protein